MPERYALIAPLYDVLSAEYPVYRAGRVCGVELLDPRPGSQVLDVGCGTGLNFPLLQDRVGPAGRIVGVDRSPQMLAAAGRRAHRHGWRNVVLVLADAVSDSPEALRQRISAAGGQEVSDAVLSTYALSLMHPWQQAWATVLTLTAPGGRAAVVDMRDPHGAAAVWTPLARLACRLGGAAIGAHPWTAVEQDCRDVRAAELRGGHLQVRAGVLPSA